MPRWRVWNRKGLVTPPGLSSSLNPLSRRGVLLIGHGTRDAQGTAEFFQLGDRLAEQLTSDYLVRPCLLEFQKPDIAEAWETLVQNDCREITVAPLLLFSAGHAKSDIPAQVNVARERTERGKGVSIRYARAISRQVSMVQAVRERLRETLLDRDSPPPGNGDSSSSPEDERTAIIMVGRGSRDVCASTDMRVLSETVICGRASGVSIASEFGISRSGIATTFYAMAGPRLPDTLSTIAGSERFDRIVVHPHLLFSGRLYDAIVEQVRVIAEQHARIRFDVSRYLGPTSLVGQAMGARIREATPHG